jgi:AcrR family transcriptional regulator
MSFREAAKGVRREKILAAARELIAEHGGTNFSMQGLAERAGMSLATPYNLIGTKQELLLLLFETDLGAFAKELDFSAQVSFIEKFKRVVEHTARRFITREDYLRPLYEAIMEPSNHELRQIFHKPRARFWTSILDDAVEVGGVREDLNPRLVAAVLDDLLRAVVNRWIWRNIPNKHIEAELGFRVFSFLLGISTPQYSELIQSFQVQYLHRLMALRARQGATADWPTD